MADLPDPDDFLEGASLAIANSRSVFVASA